MLGDKVHRFEILYRMGLRILGLAYTGPTMFADGCGERRDAEVMASDPDLIASLPDAVRELVRIGLLSEIAKVQKLVEDIRASVTNHSRQKRSDTPN